MLSLLDSLEKSPVAFDRGGRGHVVGIAHKEYAIDAQPTCLSEHKVERPGREPASSRGRSDAVADMSSRSDELAIAIAQNNLTNDILSVNDPTVDTPRNDGIVGSVRVTR
jgi:hypothetical protein